MKRLLAMPFVLAATLGLGACGSSVGSHSLNDTASRWLQVEVSAARASAAGGNNVAAVNQLQRVISDAQSLHARHMIGDARANEIQVDALRAIAALNGATASATVSTVPATFTQPVTPVPDHHKPGHHGKDG